MRNTGLQSRENSNLKNQISSYFQLSKTLQAHPIIKHRKLSIQLILLLSYFLYTPLYLQSEIKLDFIVYLQHENVFWKCPKGMFGLNRANFWISEIWLQYVWVICKSSYHIWFLNIWNGF